MLITNHVLSGALAGAVVRRRAPAFALGVASHFALDAVPHWGKWADEREFLRVAVADGLAGLAAMGVLTALAPPARRAAVLAGMTGAVLPDIDKPTGVLFGFSPWPAVVNSFHSRIQDEARGRFPREAAAAGGFAVATLLLLRGRRGSGRRRGSRGSRGSRAGRPVSGL